MNLKSTRRTFLKGVGAAVFAPAIITRPGWAQTGPIKIGAVEPMTGPAQLYGQQDVWAIQLAADRINAAGGLLGRQVEVIVADYESKTDLGARRVRDVLLDDKVDAVHTFAGAVALVCSQVAAQAGKFFVTGNSVPAELAEANFEPTTFMCSLPATSVARAMAYVAARSPHNRIYQFHPDLASGHTVGETFRALFDKLKRPEQEIVAEEYFPPFSITDFSPYVTKIDAGGPGAVVSYSYGGDLRNLLQQGHALGWKQQLINFALNDPNICKAVGDAAIGAISVQPYMLTVDNPINTALIKEWTDKYKTDELYLKFPEQAGARIVNTWSWFFDVVKKAGSLEKEAVIAAFENSTVSSPWGELTMRACDHQVVAPAFYSEIRKATDIPESIRYFGNDIPYVGPAELIPADVVTIPQAEMKNPRCKA